MTTYARRMAESLAMVQDMAERDEAMGAYERTNYGERVVVGTETRRALLVLTTFDPRIGQPIDPDSALLPASDAWIDPAGRVYPVHYAGHCRAAMEHLGDETGGERLERDGWAHVSGGRVMVRRIRQRQIDALWAIINAYMLAQSLGVLDRWHCEIRATMLEEELERAQADAEF